jgi:hypothetical protein
VSAGFAICSSGPLQVVTMERASPKSAILQMQFESSKTFDG